MSSGTTTGVSLAILVVRVLIGGLLWVFGAVLGWGLAEGVKWLCGILGRAVLPLLVLLIGGVVVLQKRDRAGIGVLRPRRREGGDDGGI